MTAASRVIFRAKSFSAFGSVFCLKGFLCWLASRLASGFKIASWKRLDQVVLNQLSSQGTGCGGPDTKGVGQRLGQGVADAKFRRKQGRSQCVLKGIYKRKQRRQTMKFFRKYFYHARTLLLRLRTLCCRQRAQKSRKTKNDANCWLLCPTYTRPIGITIFKFIRLKFGCVFYRPLCVRRNAARY